MTGPKYLFLLPGTHGRWWSGGTETFLKLARFISEQRSTEVVVYASEEPDHRSLDEALRERVADGEIWVFTTGVDVPMLIDRLAARRQLYYALESGWRLEMAPGVPIFCASRSGLAHVCEQAPGNPTYLLPVSLDPNVVNRGLERDVDILCLTRKTTAYLRDELVPILAQRCRVHVVDTFLPREKLLELFNRSKVYLYDSRSSFADGVVEGFGLQPLEAIVCGCLVISNLAGGMSDYLEPGVNCHTLRLVLQEDLDLCLKVVQGKSSICGNGEELRQKYSEEALRRRLALLLPEVENVPFPRNETAKREIERRVQGARLGADQPLYAEIRDRGRIIESLRSELDVKLRQRDEVIRAQQAELHAKVGERDVTIRTLQGELYAKVHERDATIQALQSELHNKVSERDATIRALQSELHTKVAERDKIIARLRS